jgi:hypothetical protein
MTVKRALLAVALGTTLGTGYALWDERDRGPGHGAGDHATAMATTTPIAPERVAPTAPPPAAPVLVAADSGSLALAPAAARGEPPPRDRLLADLERAKLEAPPELDHLFKLQRRGAKPRVLRSYVRAHFPRDTRLRLVVGRWIKSLEPAHKMAARQLAARPRRHGK